MIKRRNGFSVQLTPHVRKSYRKRREEIRNYRAQVILQREQERQAKKRKAEVQRQDLVNEISLAGLWQTEKDVRRELKTMRSVKQKVHKLKQQIKFTHNRVFSTFQNRVKPYQSSS